MIQHPVIVEFGYVSGVDGIVRAEARVNRHSLFISIQASFLRIDLEQPARCPELER